MKLLQKEIKQLNKYLVKRLARKYFNKIIAILVLLIVTLQCQKLGTANLFRTASQAMSCMLFRKTTSIFIQVLPSFLFTGLTLILFGYFMAASVQMLREYSTSIEPIQKPMTVFGIVLILYILQNIFLANAANC
ncbi:hypothetical protein [Nostoc sp. UHCC 0302]|uniref:hypothetical protein n=1 Tax=Nostoc sp. UHCC 0302 TaxID=3134896 RepID=UPI00311CDBBC